MRKPNLQSPLDRLDDDAQHAVYELLAGAPGSDAKPLTYEEALPEIRAKYGVKASLSSLSRFMKRRGAVEQIRTNLYVAQAFGKEADLQTLEKRQRAAITGALWEAVTNKDVASIVSLGRLALGMRADERAAEELKLAREKFEAAEKRLSATEKAVADETLSDADRVAKIKTIFGIQ